MGNKLASSNQCHQQDLPFQRPPRASVPCSAALVPLLPCLRPLLPHHPPGPAALTPAQSRPCRVQHLPLAPEALGKSFTNQYQRRLRLRSTGCCSTVCAHGAALSYLRRFCLSSGQTSSKKIKLVDVLSVELVSLSLQGGGCSKSQQLIQVSSIPSSSQRAARV